MASQKSDSFVRTRLKARQMIFLVELDAHRSVFKAAAACGMTQPAASKLLRELEHGFDVPLFDRHPRGIKPTWFGEVLIRRSRSALSEITLAQKEIAALKAGFAGKAAIGTVLSPGTSLVPQSITLAKRRRPGLRISVELDYSKPMVRKLLQGELDIVIGRVLDAHGAEDLQFEPLAEEQYDVVASNAHPLVGKRTVKLDELEDHCWILPESGSVLRDRLVGAFAELGLPPPTNVVETTSIPVITSLLRSADDMLAVLTHEAAQPYCQADMLKVLVPSLNVQTGVFGILTHRHRELSPGAEILLTALRETASDLYSRAKLRIRAAAR